MRFSLPTLLAALLVPCACALADTRVEVLSRVTFNGFSYGYCAGPQPCPLTNVRVGEYSYMTFVTSDVPFLSQVDPTPCPGNPAAGRTISGYNINDGSFFIRMSDVTVAAPVGFDTANNRTVPYITMSWQECSVDRMDLNGGAVGRGGGCCYPNGSCTYVFQTDCQGVWTLGSPCSTLLNPCTQPTGVCCDFNNGCTLVTQATCTTAGGFSWTAGGVCTAGISCPQDAGSCCATSGSCALTTAARCSDTWTSGGVCSATTCTQPAFTVDYLILQMTAGGASGTPGFFNTADITQNYRTFPGSSMIPDYQFAQLGYGFVDSAGIHNFDLDIPLQKMVISSSTTATGACCPGDGHCLVTTHAICPTSSWTSGATCVAGTTCPDPAGGCCLPTGSCDLRTASACAATANSLFQGANSVCVPSPCASTGGCCNGGSCTIVYQTTCIAAGGSWLGAGSTCDIVAQHVATFSGQAGACCTNGTCSLVSRQSPDCGTSSVFTLGATCSVTPCANAGACCDPTGGCTIARANLCNTNPTPPTVPSTYLGDGTSCSPIPCPNIGPCCNTNTGLCTMVVQSYCPAATSTWSATGTCASICVAGRCCNLVSHQCSLYTQAQCGAWNPGNTTWDLASTCETVCTYPYIPLNDAVFISGNPGTTVPSTFTNTISVATPGTVSEVEVWVNFFCERANGIRITLTGPNGVTKELMTRVGSASPCTTTPIGGGAVVGNIPLGSATVAFNPAQYVFLDAAATDISTAITSGVGASGGRFRPAGCAGTPVVLNSAYAGIPIAGNWTLTIIDERTGSWSNLYSWGLSFNGGYPAPCTVGHCVAATGGCVSSTYSQCPGSSTWSIGACSTTSCSAGTPGACCYLNTCTVVCQSLCPSGALFAGYGSACSTGICNVACCTTTGSCTMTTAANCGGAAGIIGSTCSPNTCPQPRACCQAAGVCTMVQTAGCTAVGGTSGATGSTCVPNTCPGAPVPPANDVCSLVASGGAGAADIVLTNAYTAVQGTLVGATPDGVVPSCGLSAGPDVWYRFTPPGTGNYILSTCLGQPDTLDSQISVWTNCTTQVPTACDDNGCGFNNQAKLTVALTGGTPYLVRVALPAASTPNASAFSLEVGGLGACCIRNSSCYTGLCVITHPNNCSGVYQGFATSCQPNLCPQELGQCCLTTGGCVSTCVDACHAQGGFMGVVGTTCSANNNPCPIGTCCRGATCVAGYPQVSCQGYNTSFVAIEGCNAPGNSATPCCYADYNKLNGISIQDIFDFLNDWFAGSLFAITGGNGSSGTLSVQNIFDFLNVWFAGGC